MSFVQYCTQSSILPAQWYTSSSLSSLAWSSTERCASFAARVRRILQRNASSSPPSQQWLRFFLQGDDVKLPNTSPPTVSIAMRACLVPRTCRSNDGREGPSRTSEYLSQKLALSEIEGGKKFWRLSISGGESTWGWQSVSSADVPSILKGRVPLAPYPSAYSSSRTPQALAEAAGEELVSRSSHDAASVIMSPVARVAVELGPLDLPPLEDLVDIISSFERLLRISDECLSK
mmetsp:Transcript_30414/g.64562  ORF Transcript_30414/g.64562 Transcript_30414/m.64562 type:complete len:233 (+) Transcript_30414:426-1124(+)